MEPSVTTSLPWTDIVVAFVAVYAAGLSTYTYFNDKRQRKPRLNVAWNHVITTGLMSDGELLYQITASNPHSIPVTVSRVGLLLPDNNTFQFIRPSNGSSDIPCELTQGKRAQFLMERDAVLVELGRSGYSGVIEVRAFCASQTDDMYTSKVFKLTIE